MQARGLSDRLVGEVHSKLNELDALGVMDAVKPSEILDLKDAFDLVLPKIDEIVASVPKGFVSNFAKAAPVKLMGLAPAIVGGADLKQLKIKHEKEAKLKARAINVVILLTGILVGALCL